jgi:hypothetical protein
MSCLRPLAAAALALAVLAPAASAAVTVDPATRTITTPRFTVAFDATNPEQLTSLKWAGIPDAEDLAAEGGISPCGDATEAWGQSYGDPQPLVAMVRGGSRGTWTDQGDGTIRIDSQITEPECGGFQGQLPVQTTYRFFGEGDQFAVTRRLDIGPEPASFTQGHLRPYVPRLPRVPYTHTQWVSDSGFNDSIATSCQLNFCVANGWNGAWFADHDPDTGRGLLVVRAASDTPSRLLVDSDGPSLSNSSSVDFVPDVFDTALTETEFLCFYTEATWPAAEREAGRPPSWCGPSLTIRDARVSESGGTATLTVERSVLFGAAPRFAVAAADGTARTPIDYGPPVAGTFADGAATTTVTVPIVDDPFHEGPETFTVRLTDVRGATIGGGTATVTIDDDDAAYVPPAGGTSNDTDTSASASGLGGTGTTARRPVKVGRASQYLTLPTARSCRAGQPLSVKLRHPKGQKVAYAVLKLNGKVVKTVRGTRPLTLHRVPRGKFTVSVAVVTTTNTVATATRAYQACAAAR